VSESARISRPGLGWVGVVVGAVEHGGVGAEAGERGHQVGGVAEDGDAGPGVPAVAHRQRVNRADDELVVALFE
jgi:hypothetical protein